MGGSISRLRNGYPVMRPEIHPQIEGLQPHGRDEVIDERLITLPIGFGDFLPGDVL
jgi:hypothetical protein